MGLLTAFQPAQLPRAEQFLGLFQRQALAPNWTRNIDSSGQAKAVAGLVDCEQELVGERAQMRLALFGSQP